MSQERLAIFSLRLRCQLGSNKKVQLRAGRAFLLVAAEKKPLVENVAIYGCPCLLIHNETLDCFICCRNKSIFILQKLAKTWIYVPYSIRMYWTNFWQPTDHIQLNIFEKTLIEIGSSHLYASFGTFCVQIGQFFEAQWVFENCLKTVKSLFSKENVVNFEISLWLE